MRIYAIGDIHGRADLLDQLLERIDAQLAADPVCRPVEIYLGDYIDRGPSSRAVLERLIARSRERETVCLKGNHEIYVEDFLSNPAIFDKWRVFGGLETLLSYGVAPSVNMNWAEQPRTAAAFRQALPESHRRFLGSLISSFTCGDYFFVHAGVRPGIPLRNQREEDLLSIRQDFLLCEADFSKIVVHGHTPVREPDIRHNRINIDTGAYATGQLTCLILEGNERHFIQATLAERVAVAPSEQALAPEIRPDRVLRRSNMPTGGAKTERKLRVVVDNRKARFHYFIDETFEAGLALTGTEVKSLRQGKAAIAESYADARGGEIWLINSNIPEYLQANRFNHAPKRPRKLLLHRRQINKLVGAVEREGMTLVPLKLYFNEKGQAKVELALARGKKLYDKRETQKKRSWERERGRLMRQKG